MRCASTADLSLLLSEALDAACGDITCMALVVCSSYLHFGKSICWYCTLDVGKAAVGVSLAPLMTSSPLLCFRQTQDYKAK